MRQNRATTAVTAFGICLGISTFVEAEIYYVDPDGSDTEDRTTWATAFRTPQDALAYDPLEEGDVIRVAGDTYYPDEWYEGDTFYDTNDRTKSFRLESGVTLMGGYAGLGAPDPNARHLGDHPTILSGDIDKDDVLDDDNSYHVVVSDLNPAGTLIDGFIIECGNANDDDADNYNIGGGALLQGTYVTFVRCTIRNNKATGDINTDGYGGGVAAMAKQVGIVERRGQPYFFDCRLHDNEAKTGGGAIWLGFTATANFLNSLIDGNDGGYKGGAAYSAPAAANLEFVNCTIVSNAASVEGGGLYFSYNAVGTLTNCIVWGNSSGQIAQGSPAGDLAVTYSDIQGGWIGDGNIAFDPQFRAGDYRLKPTSPCIDTGLNSPFNDDQYQDNLDLDSDSDTSEAMPDLDITDRIVDHGGGSIVDMGAYESDLCPADVNQDGFVDINDIFAVLAAWGPCEDCLEDINNDDVVDIDDLFAVLAGWGCGDPDPAAAPQSIMDCILQYSSDPEDLATCIEAIMLINEE